MSSIHLSPSPKMALYLPLPWPELFLCHPIGVSQQEATRQVVLLALSAVYRGTHLWACKPTNGRLVESTPLSEGIRIHSVMLAG